MTGQRTNIGPLEREALGLLRQVVYHLRDPSEIREAREAALAIEYGVRPAPRPYLDELRRVARAYEDRYHERPGTPRYYARMLRGKLPGRESPAPALPRLESF